VSVGELAGRSSLESTDEVGSGECSDMDLDIEEVELRSV